MDELEFTDGHIEQIVSYQVFDNRSARFYCQTASGDLYLLVRYYESDEKLGYMCGYWQWQKFNSELCEFFNTNDVSQARIFKTI